MPATVTPAPAPDLPATYTVNDGFKTVRVKFLAASREWYEAWNARGEAAGFGATDWLFVRDVVAPMFDRARRGGSVERVRELRMQLQVLEKLATDRLAAKPADDGADDVDAGLAEVLQMIRPGA